MSTSLDKLRQAMESASPSQGEKKSYDDDKYWKPELDKSGNGYAIVRFLPTPENEEMPWVSYFDHGFQGPGGCFFENCLTTLGKNDPVSEYNTRSRTLTSNQNREHAVNRAVDFIMCLTSMLFQTLNIPRTKKRIHV